MLDQDDRFNIVELSESYEDDRWFQKLTKSVIDMKTGATMAAVIGIAAIALPQFVKDTSTLQLIYGVAILIIGISLISSLLYKRNWFGMTANVSVSSPVATGIAETPATRGVKIGQLIKTDKLSPEPYLKRLIQTLPGTVIRIDRDRSRIAIEKDYGLPIDSIISELQLIGAGATEQQSPLWNLHQAIEDTFESGRSHRARFNLTRDGRRLLLDARCIPGNNKSLWVLLKDIEKQAEMIPITGLNERRF